MPTFELEPASGSDYRTIRISAPSDEMEKIIQILETHSRNMRRDYFGLLLWRKKHPDGEGPETAPVPARKR